MGNGPECGAPGKIKYSNPHPKTHNNPAVPKRKTFEPRKCEPNPARARGENRAPRVEKFLFFREPHTESSVAKSEETICTQ